MFKFINSSMKLGATGTAWRTRRQIAAAAVRMQPGFTLVELLVALGLVSLLMLLFAQVFQIATDTMGKQRGVMENDQRARSLTIILTNDLNNRSLRNVTPFQPGEVDYASSVPYSFVQRQGFLSISENDPNNDAEDVLHFTAIFSAQTADDTTSDEANIYYGKATPFAGALADLATYANQPEVDDGSTYVNFTATSHMAEIVYFVRNGNLYRRVMLIREPLNDAFDSQPFSSSTYNYFDYINNPGLGLPSYPNGSNFWRDFDFSATTGSGVKFIGSGTAGLNPLSNGSAGGFFPIGKPPFRFGHDPDAANANTSSAPASVGNPREFVGTTFIGRFTHEETSHSNFNFPHSSANYEIDPLPGTPYSFAGSVGNDINDGNPMKTIGVNNNPLSDLNANSIVDQFEAGEIDTRRGEDILLSNVHAFDVKVWDEIIGDYVDVGHALTSAAGTAGDFHQGRNRRPSYGPKPAGNNRMFDTWHPNFDASGDGVVNITNTDDRPPFLPKKDYTAYPTWTNNNSYNVGDRVIPTNSSVESFYYECTFAGTSAALATNEPNWPKNDLQLVPDGSVIWQARYNLKPVKSLKITIRYLDVTSDQMRQVTLIQSLMN